MTPRAARRSPLDASQSGTAPVHFPGLEAIRALAASMVVVHHVSSAAGGTAGMIAPPAEGMGSGLGVLVAADTEDRPRVLDRAERSVGHGQRLSGRHVVAALPVVAALRSLHGTGWFGGGMEPEYRGLLLPDRSSPGLDRPSNHRCPIDACWSISSGQSFGSDDCALSRRLAGTHRPSYGSLVNRALSFQWLPTNLDLFAAGMLLAVGSVWAGLRAEVGLRVATFTRKAWPWWSGAALLFVAYAYGVGGVDFAVGYQGWAWQLRQFAFTLCAVLLLIPAVFGGQGDGWLRRLWRWGPVAWVGTVSYGLYLWHVGVMERLVERPAGSRTPTDPGWPGWLSDLGIEPSFVSLLVGTFVIALMAAATSWYLVEKPLQRGKAIFDGVTRRG